MKPGVSLSRLENASSCKEARCARSGIWRSRVKAERPASEEISAFLGTLESGTSLRYIYMAESPAAVQSAAGIVVLVGVSETARGQRRGRQRVGAPEDSPSGPERGRGESGRPGSAAAEGPIWVRPLFKGSPVAGRRHEDCRSVDAPLVPPCLPLGGLSRLP
ncbi:hypothetical protein HPB47_027477 [Ixodes persulcatus]|uniref:Uncharacterized protein n=1 Tax=Ixodes persulcatus TaxID=34615 RepID=A0AC60PVQ9_IXOPE|nr:hypothetical protein HPB47_027477 [Ixodes persulcatus]